MSTIISLYIGQNKIEIPKGVKTLYNNIVYTNTEDEVKLLKGSYGWYPDGFENGKRKFSKITLTKDVSVRLGANTVIIWGNSYRMLTSCKIYVSSTPSQDIVNHDFWYDLSTNLLKRYSTEYTNIGVLDYKLNTNGTSFSFLMIKIVTNSSTKVIDVQPINEINVETDNIVYYGDNSLF